MVKKLKFEKLSAAHSCAADASKYVLSKKTVLEGAEP